MRASDGYCPRTGGWMNALDDTPRYCYVGEDEMEFDPAAPHPPVRKAKPKKKVERPPVNRVPEGMKRCPTCGRTLPKERFCKCLRRYDGLNWECKECAAAHTREREARKRAQAAGKYEPATPPRTDNLAV